MEWSSVVSFIQPELLIVVVFLWCIGLFLKKAPWFSAEWTIPFILLAISLVITILYLAIILGDGFSAKVILAGIIQAVILAAVAVFGNEILKQTIDKRLDDTASTNKSTSTSTDTPTETTSGTDANK